MAKKTGSKISFYDEEKLKKINPETVKLWERYKIDMSLRELSEKTIAGYENDMQQFFIYVYDNFDNKSIKEIDDEDITEFLYYCKTNGNNSRRIKRRMSSISAFYIFLRRKRVVSENPMEFIERPKKDTDVATQTFLTLEQVNLMRDKLNEFVNKSKTLSSKHYSLQIQCYAMFSLTTMARVNAVRSIEWSQIDYEDRIVHDVPEKEGYIVKLYISEEVKDLLINLQKFRKENNIDDNGFVFISRSKDGAKKVTTGTMNRWSKVVGAMIDVPTLQPHDFRRSYATLLSNAGMPLEEISELLNHMGTDVTNRHYIKSDGKRLKASKDSFEI